MTHTRECFAKALICAVENVRDAADFYGDPSSFDYVSEATRYLDDGLTTCTCPAQQLAHDAATALDAAGSPIVDDSSYFLILEGSCYGLISGSSVRQAIANGSRASFARAQ